MFGIWSIADGAVPFMLRRIFLAPEALLPLFWAILWWPVISGRDVFFMRDLTQFAVPMKTYMLERLSSGELPLWTPYVSGGMPFLADPANQVFYPPNAVFFLFFQIFLWFVGHAFIPAAGSASSSPAAARS